MDEQQEKVRELADVFNEVLGEYDNSLEVLITNFYSAIRVTNSTWELNLWVRIRYIGEQRLLVDLASISLPEELRRKGILTKLFNRIKEVEDVYKIKVTSALTDEMKSWCNKNHLIQENELDYAWTKETVQ